MYPWVLAAYLTATTADVASGWHARSVGAHEQILPASVAGQIAVTAGLAGVEIGTTRWLWTHHHRRIAVVVLAGSAVGHGLAARHNWSLK